MRSRWLTIVQAIIGLVIVGFVARAVVANWDTVRESHLVLAFRPGWMLLSLGITWVAYAGLIQGWRGVVHGWGDAMGFRTAARIWVLASFGKYLPGKVWAIAGMAMLSERAGVRGKVSTAAAIVMQLLAIGTGVVVAALAIRPELERAQPGAGYVLLGLGVVAAGSLAVVGSRRVLAFMWRLAGREGPPPGPPRRGALVEGIVLNVAAWLCYGTAFWALGRGLLPEIELGWGMATGAFAAAYLAGFLAPFAPGGIGVREALLIALLRPAIGYAPALALMGASRLVITINELGAAAPFLLFRESRRDRS